MGIVRRFLDVVGHRQRRPVVLRPFDLCSAVRSLFRMHHRRVRLVLVGGLGTVHFRAGTTISPRKTALAAQLAASSRDGAWLYRDGGAPDGPGDSQRRADGLKPGV